MEHKAQLVDYILRIGDSALILGHRLSEWCGHGPVLEQDIALTNIALDLVGQARSLLTYAGEIEGQGRSEDDLAFLRDVYDYKNVLLAEQPNGHFGDTIARQFYYDTFNYYFLKELEKSSDEQLAGFATKSLKEVSYHLRHSTEWIIRLGDGTAESHEKIQKSLDDLYMFTGELFQMDEIDAAMIEAGIGVDLNVIRTAWNEHMQRTFAEATLTLPDSETWMQSGGKTGQHGEHLGFLLAEMQFLPRAYPGATW